MIARMELRPLGRSGFDISPVIVGCGSIGAVGGARNTIGQGLTDAEGFAMLDTAVDLGITVLDTANGYAGGHSEQVIGRWLADRGKRMLIATKVGGSVEPGQEGIDLSRDHILRQIDASLNRLGVDHVDMYLSHAPDERTPIEETLTAFAELLDNGKVKAIGGCNLSAAQLESMLDISDRHGLPRYEWVQNEYSLLAHNDDEDVIPLCKAHGLGYTPHSTLCGGILSGRYAPGVAPPPGSRVAVRPGLYHEYMTSERLEAVQRFVEAAQGRGMSSTSLAHAWVMSNPSVTAPLIAPRHMAQFDAITAAMTIRLREDDRAALATLVAVG
jgi:aryl-alcohol dehydrogenase-like predicted oxidoreductase